jgi:tRNA A-37 threonylcarbamoyl transferase component Bud32
MTAERDAARSEKEIFLEAIEMTADERPGYLEEACGTDQLLRRRVEALLAKHFQEDGFLAKPALASSPTEAVQAPLPEALGEVIGRYRLLEKIGEGGFGAVYVAEQREPVKRRVALKVIKLGMDTRQVVARFEAERQALALMDHPNIARVLDAGATEAGRPYFVMELVRGAPITQYADANNLPTAERLALFIAVCNAIQHAHQKGIIHRDIKPSNVLVTLHDGRPVPKVIDFGIAKATQGDLTEKTIYTQFQQLIGTPAYLSPEQAEMGGLDLDTRSDIYSLGVLLYELLIGRTPFDSKELLQSGLDELRRVIREKEPPRPSTRLGSLAAADLTTTARRRGADGPKLIHALRGDLDWIAMRCLEKDRSRRYDTAAALAADVERHLNDEPVLARPPSKAYRLRKLVRRHRGAAAALGAVALALVLGLGLSTFAFLRERKERLSREEAEKAKAVETVRADAVGTFMEKLLRKTAPELLLQGHQRPVRDLLEAADQLASTALSGAPAAEFQLRGLMSVLYLSDGPSLLDPAACHAQVERIVELLPQVPEDKLPDTRDAIRIGAAGSMLWAGRSEDGLQGLRAIEDELRRRTPPAPDLLAWCLAMEGNWRLWKGEAASAEEKLAEAMRLITPGAPPEVACYIRVHLAQALSDRGAVVEAEKLTREGLLPPSKVSPEAAGLHFWLLREVVNALCRQKRFADAVSLLEEHERGLAAAGCPPRTLLFIRKAVGEVLARSGNAREALPILRAAAMDELGTVHDCADAAFVALGSGDVEAYRRLSAIGLARFAAGAEGFAALRLAETLLALPQDALVLEVAGDLVSRVENARDYSRELATGLRDWLDCRGGRPSAVAALWPRPAGLAPPTSPIVARISRSDGLVPLLAFRSALALGLLGRVEEAERAHAEGLKALARPPSAEEPRDLGEGYAQWYLAEAHRREAEEALRSKAITIPTDGEPPSK